MYLKFIRDFKCGILETGFWKRDFGNGILVTGFSNAVLRTQPLPETSKSSSRYFEQFLLTTIPQCSSKSSKDNFTSHETKEDHLLSAPELIIIIKDIYHNLSAGKTKMDQIMVITSIMCKYIYKLD